MKFSDSLVSLVFQTLLAEGAPQENAQHVSVMSSLNYFLVSVGTQTEGPGKSQSVGTQTELVGFEKDKFDNNNPEITVSYCEAAENTDSSYSEDSEEAKKSCVSAEKIEENYNLEEDSNEAEKP